MKESDTSSFPQYSCAVDQLQPIKASINLSVKVWFSAWGMDLSLYASEKLDLILSYYYNLTFCLSAHLGSLWKIQATCWNLVL